ncbi:MAG: hypothetical protein GY746_10820 [Gammaproteobacteria bacterium]|nr:hypothetical protein [Gammaproteobacteria bacterium]
MAFEGENFIRASAQANGNATHTYESATDDLATVKGANYFDLASATSGGYGLKNGDFILAVGTDGASFLRMVIAGDGGATVGLSNDFV